MTNLERLKYMLNVPEDYDTRDIAIFLSLCFNIEDDISDIIDKLENKTEF